nr:hypothetical protein [Salinispora fenicalii]
MTALGQGVVEDHGVPLIQGSHLGGGGGPTGHQPYDLRPADGDVTLLVHAQEVGIGLWTRLG